MEDPEVREIHPRGGKEQCGVAAPVLALRVFSTEWLTARWIVLAEQQQQQSAALAEPSFMVCD